MLLNRANMILGFALISLGGISGTVADPKIILGAKDKYYSFADENMI